MVQAPQEAPLVAEEPEVAHVRRLLASKALSLQGYDSLLHLLAEGNGWPQAGLDEVWQGILQQTQAALHLISPRDAGSLLRKLGPLWEKVLAAYQGPDLLELPGISLHRIGSALVLLGEFKHLSIRLARVPDRLFFETMARGPLKGNKGEGYVAGICQDQEVWVTQRQTEFLCRTGLGVGYGGVRMGQAHPTPLPVAELDAHLQLALAPFLAALGEADGVAFDWLVERHATALRARAALFWPQGPEALQLEVCGIAEADSLLRTGRMLLAQRLMPEIGRRLAVRYGDALAKRLLASHSAAMITLMGRFLAKGVPLVGEGGVVFVMEGAVERVLQETLIDGKPLAAWAMGQSDRQID